MSNTTRATIKDVAKASGSSIATVSRVLNNSDYPVRTELRQKILNAADALNYMPNLYGRLLKNGVSNDIGVIIPSLSNPFYAETVSGIERECRKLGYNPVFCTSNNNRRLEREYIDFFLQKCMAGILISTVYDDCAYLEDALKINPNIVLFDQATRDCRCDHIAYDFFAAGAMAAEYLIEKGHTDIAFLSTPFEHASRKARFDGFFDALKRHNIPIKKSRLFIRALNSKDCESDFSDFENGCELAKTFLKESCPATAIVAVNDITAIGVISELTRNNRSLPDDVSIIGFDNIKFSAMVMPPFTTIEQPSFEMGKLATHLLIDKIENKMTMSIMLNPSIVERQSVKNLLG